jgi:alpha-galactosidase
MRIQTTGSLLALYFAIALPTLDAESKTTNGTLQSLAITSPTPAPPPEWPAPLTPPAPLIPRVNGPLVFGVRPGSPFFYAIPATGKRPMTFAAEGLPSGLSIDTNTGLITGTVSTAGTNSVNLIARNEIGEAKRPFRIVVGEKIGLTPAMGWNSYNVWGTKVTQERALGSAKGMVISGLTQHGWAYVNIDDGWQGIRGGPVNALQVDTNRFTDMARFCADLHAMGLKAGIYHTPWVMSYAGRPGGTSEDPAGLWNPKVQWPGKNPPNEKILPKAIGRYSFVDVDAKQFGDWGFDYLKYDWNPIEAPETILMHQALRRSGRDIILSLSNNHKDTLSRTIRDVAPNAESWRTGTDINDSWKSVYNLGFSSVKWAPYQSPGHLNDPDMLVVGRVGWGNPHPTRLTPDEQYTHISLWCLLSAPLLLGCDLEQLDPFTLGLITNDEVLAIDQDEFCKPAVRVTPDGPLKVYVKELADGSKSVGLFNTGETPARVTLDWKQAGLSGKQTLRDLWRQMDLGTFVESYAAEVPSHGVLLLKVSGSRI